jgi:sugar phosphate isomerase/epimerase
MHDLPDIGLGTANLLTTSLPEFIALAARHGFRRITVRPHAYLQALRQGHTEAGLRQQLADAGIQVSMIDALTHGLPGVSSPDTWDAATRAQVPADALNPPDEACCLQAACALGTSILNVVAYQGKVVPVSEMADALGGLCQRAAPLGIRIALEFLPESGIPDVQHARRVLEACDQPNLGLMLDVFHLGRSGGTVDDVRRFAAGAITSIQLSDRHAGTVGHVAYGGRLMPGEGQLPLHELVAVSLENNPAATLDIEVLNDELRSLPADTATSRLAAAAAHWRSTYYQSRPAG